MTDCHWPSQRTSLLAVLVLKFALYVHAKLILRTVGSDLIERPAQKPTAGLAMPKPEVTSAVVEMRATERAGLSVESESAKATFGIRCEVSQS